MCLSGGGGNNLQTMEAVDFYFRVVFQTSEQQLSSDADLRLSCHFETAMSFWLAGRPSASPTIHHSECARAARRNDFKEEATEIAAAQSDCTLAR